MGINHLPQLLKEGLQKKKITSAGLSGLVVGVDISVFMYLALHYKRAVDQFWVEPRVPVTALKDYFDCFESALKAAEIQDIVFVFDGANHPMKAVENARRCADREIKVELLRRLYNEFPDDATKYGEAQKLKSSTVHPRPDVILTMVSWIKSKGYKCVGSPFEADAQLVELSDSRIIDVILTTDSDIFVLGATKLILDFKVNNIKPENSTCYILERTAIVNKLTRYVLGETSSMILDGQLLIEYAVFLGCDYLPNLEGWGVKKVTKWFRDNWCRTGTQSEDRQQLLHLLSTTAKHRDGCGHSIETYVADFWNAVNMFLHPPVFKTNHTTDLENRDNDIAQIRNNLEDGTYDILLQPLRQIETNMSWCGVISFDPVQLIRTINTSRHVAEDELLAYYKLCHKMDVWAKTGAMLETATLPKHIRAKDGAELPHESIIFFDKYPWWTISAEQWILWLEYRGIPVPKHESADYIRQEAKRIIRLNQLAGINNDDAVDMALVYLNENKDTAYRSWESLQPPTSAGIIWSADGDSTLQKLRLQEPDGSRMVHILDNEYVNSIFGIRRSGVRSRAMLRVKDGHYNLKKLYTCDAVLSNQNNNEEPQPVTVFKFVVTPSLKSEEYDMYLVFQKGTGHYIFAPVSRCSCPAGRYLCSHMLGGLQLLAILQNVTDSSSMQYFIDYMPEPVISTSTEIILASMLTHVYGNNNTDGGQSSDSDNEN
jgi:5'-3' exonuclease